MPENNNNKPQSEFLYKALEDAQNTIRFTDTKAGVLVVTSGALCVYLVPLAKTLLDHMIPPFPLYSLFIFVSGVLCVAGFMLSLLLCLRVIRPLTFPNKYVPMNSLATKIPFYLARIEAEPNLRERFLEQSTSRLIADPKQLYDNLVMNNASEEIIKSLVLEVCKVSYIREKKIRRVSIAFNCFEFGLLFMLITTLMSYFAKWL